MKKRNILLGLALAFCFTACYDLDKMPEGVLSTAEPFLITLVMSLCHLGDETSSLK